MNIKFIFDIIDGFIVGLNEDYLNGIITEEEKDSKIDILETLKNTYKDFIKNANQN